jgi:hypothetical protein
MCSGEVDELKIPPEPSIKQSNKNDPTKEMLYCLEIHNIREKLTIITCPDMCVENTVVHRIEHVKFENTVLICQ